MSFGADQARRALADLRDAFRDARRVWRDEPASKFEARFYRSIAESLVQYQKAAAALDDALIKAENLVDH